MNNFNNIINNTLKNPMIANCKYNQYLYKSDISSYYIYDKVYFKLPNGQEKVYELTKENIAHYDKTDVIKFNCKFEINLTNKLLRDFCNKYGYDPYEIVRNFDNYNNAIIIFENNFNLIQTDNMGFNKADGSFGRNILLKSDMRSCDCYVEEVQLNKYDIRTEMFTARNLTALIDFDKLNTYILSNITFKVETIFK